MNRIISSLLLGNFIAFILYILESIYIVQVYKLTLINKDELVIFWYALQVSVISYVICKYKIYDMLLKDNK